MHVNTPEIHSENFNHVRFPETDMLQPTTHFVSGIALQTSQSDVKCDEDSESDIRIFIAALVPKLQTI